MPLFPLHAVLFPGGVIPLHVFEERYRLLVREGRDFGVILIRSGREVRGAGEGDAEPELHRVGTMAAMERVQALPDGRFTLLARGLRRFRLDRLDRSRPYLMGEVEELPDPPAQPSPRLLSLLREYLGLHGLEVEVRAEAGVGQSVAWLAGAILQAEPAKLQTLLESGQPSLAESFLAEEVERSRRLGRLGTVPPRQPSAN